MTNVINNSVVNYSREFYNTTEHNYSQFFKNYVLDEKVCTEIKKEISRLSNLLLEQTNKYSTLMTNRYNSEITPLGKSNVFKYTNRNFEKIYFDASSCAPLTIDDETGYNIVDLSNKNGDTNIVVGYVLSLGSVVVRNYKYSIPSNNSRINLTFLNEIIIPVVDTNAHAFLSDKYNEVSDLGTLSVNRYSCNKYFDYLKPIDGKEFLSLFYGIDAGCCDINLCAVAKAYRTHASMETIVRQAPEKSLKNLLKLQNDEFKKNLAQYLGITKPELKAIVENDLMGKFIDLKLAMQEIDDANCVNWIKLKDTKTMAAWIDLLNKSKGWEEDFNFYGIRYSYKSVLIDLIYRYVGYKKYTSGGYKNYSNYYTFGDFCAYVIEGCINQGYTSLDNFVTELSDYLSMSEQLNVKPIMNSGYLKQTHDIMSRNYNIKINELQEEIFASRYKDFKPWISKDKKYTLIAPKNSEDVKIEGSNMNNCVGSYIKRILDDTCKIFFFRATNKPDESLITVEYRDDAMVQVKRSHNRSVNPIDIKYLTECCASYGWQYKG